MPTCPNCARETMRTADWVCQWCGYPLLSKSFKKIDKTYRELQEERNRARAADEAEMEIEAEAEEFVETPPEPDFEDMEPEREPEYQPESGSAPESVQELEPEYRRELPPTPSGPVQELTTPPEIEEEPVAEATESEKAPESTAQQRSTAEAAPPEESEPMITPPPPVPGTTPAPPEPETAQPQPEPEPAPVTPPPSPAPQPAPAVPLTPGDISDGMEINVDQLNELFRADKSLTNTSLKDKTIVVNGRLSKIFIRDHIDVRYLVLDGADKRNTWSVRCSFDKAHVTEMTRLSEGSAVTVKGRYDGYSKNILFKDCTIV